MPQWLAFDARNRSSFTTLAGLVDGFGRERFALGPTGPLTPTGISPARDFGPDSVTYDRHLRFPRLFHLGLTLMRAASASHGHALPPYFSFHTSGVNV